MEKKEHRQPIPGKRSYLKLMNDLEEGDIQIPRFQRDFVWDLEKATKLLDSILKGYPVGTFTLWKIDTSSHEDPIGNYYKEIDYFDIPKPKEGHPIKYVLDGQQRISSLYAAHIGAKVPKNNKKPIDYKNIYVDLEAKIEHNDSQIIVKDKPDRNYITLHDLLRKGNAFFRNKYKGQYEYINLISDYKEIFTNYVFSTITFEQSGIEPAIEIFTRINTVGKTLTLFNIIAAKNYDAKREFDMQDKLKKFMSDLKNKKSNYETISSTIILYVLSLSLSENKDCKRKTILNLEKNDIINNWDKVIKSISWSIDYFKNKYHIYFSKLLPYELLLVPFAYFHLKNKQKDPNGKQSKFLEEFFWRMSLSNRYRNSSDSKLGQDIRRIDKILGSEKPSYSDIQLNFTEPNYLRGKEFSISDSFSKAIICLLVSCEPRNFKADTLVPIDNSNLYKKNSKNYHHFFPQAYLKNKGIENVNSIVNITLISSGENQEDFKDKAPKKYITECSKENSKLDKILKENHLIDDIKKFGIYDNDYEVFLEERSKAIYDKLKEKLGGSI